MLNEILKKIEDKKGAELNQYEVSVICSHITQLLLDDKFNTFLNLVLPALVDPSYSFIENVSRLRHAIDKFDVNHPPFSFFHQKSRRELNAEYHGIIKTAYRKMVEGVLELIHLIKQLPPAVASQLDRYPQRVPNMLKLIASIPDEDYRRFIAVTKDVSLLEGDIIKSDAVKYINLLDNLNVYPDFGSRWKPIKHYLKSIDFRKIKMPIVKEESEPNENLNIPEVGYNSSYVDYPPVEQFCDAYSAFLVSDPLFIAPHSSSSEEQSVTSKVDNQAFGEFPDDIVKKENFVRRQNRTVLYQIPGDDKHYMAVKFAKIDEPTNKFFSEAAVIKKLRESQVNFATELPEPICCIEGRRYHRRRMIPNLDDVRDLGDIIKCKGEIRNPDYKRQNDKALYIYKAPKTYFQSVSLIEETEPRHRAAIKNTYGLMKLLQPHIDRKKQKLQLQMEIGILHTSRCQYSSYGTLSHVLSARRPMIIPDFIGTSNVEESGFRVTGLADYVDTKHIRKGDSINTATDTLLSMSLQLSAFNVITGKDYYANEAHKKAWLDYAHGLIYQAAMMAHLLSGIPLKYAYQTLSKKVSAEKVAEEAFIWMTKKHAEYIDRQQPLPENLYGKNNRVSLHKERWDYKSGVDNTFSEDSYRNDGNKPTAERRRILGVWGGVDPRVNYIKLVCEMNMLIIKGVEGKILHRAYCQAAIECYQRNDNDGAERLLEKADKVAPWSTIHKDERLKRSLDHSSMDISSDHISHAMASNLYFMLSPNVPDIVRACHDEFKTQTNLQNTNAQNRDDGIQPMDTEEEVTRDEGNKAGTMMDTDEDMIYAEQTKRKSSGNRSTAFFKSVRREKELLPESRGSKRKAEQQLG